MHIRITRAALVRELTLLHGVVDRKVTIPILSRVLLTAWAKGHISIAATNLSDSLLADAIEAEVLVSGQVALPADLLLSIARVVPDGLIELEATAKSSHCELTSGNTKVRLPLMDPRDFPQLPNAPETLVTVPAGELRELLRQTRYAAPTSSLGTYINGILVELDSSIRLVALDGHRLGMSYRTLAVPATTPQKFILPVRASAALDAMLAEADAEEPVSISSSENVVCFRCEQRLFTARLLEAKFPAYASILKRMKHTTVVDVDREGLLQALKRLATVVTKEHQAVLLDMRDGHIFLELDTATGRATDQVLVDIQGEPAQVRVNLAYAVEFLSLMAADAMKIGNCPEGRVLELGPVEPGVTCVLGTVAPPASSRAAA
ncbi:DnaN DNA polymerase sliding clamp subunit (PCNA homolog) [uncultured Caudovirales phage]|uniref:DnaN DNA polymerase sliding clamp subunit (PCNA homolog) n=1 Tax=uncultured Caudovirales phage TaxID=2100421 RepID=A0A6J5SHT1_9CAUD|nr:DnaN DNA polymerase sliding clamp subunit (PCNA homolog) [uncultured Caudovirales phage]CAB4199070.1 DnaN DNA polymerase sliding clamp subunit (PCNA homolog) [uncultured Caudovirales phage]CAB4213091.1 DnaN DNA polymerase sliding clamp subunit (PCNA homolog) [uncultured Caudovirales phage]CAB5228096.1 DnaN DNA polymerase sliding clamp subunit (PCNA homolog) [uncultured Caudovirales phage]